MNYWQVLHQTVGSSLQSEQIGTPLFVRGIVVLADTSIAKEITLQHYLAMLTGYINTWLSATATSVYALAPQPQHVTLTLGYANGSTALLSMGSVPTNPHIDLAILGSGGAIYHNEFIQPARDGSIQLTNVDENILNAIEQSLNIGKAVAFVQENVS